MIEGTPIPLPKPRPITTSTNVRRAETLVRHYLGALMRGDEPRAYHYLGTTPGDNAASLSEEVFIDHSAHITSVVGQDDPNGTNVQAEVNAKHGLYFLTFRVEPKNGQLIITSHDFIKP
jgi:hypothetical protein